MKRNGFTLIQLLIVLAIISMLAISLCVTIALYFLSDKTITNPEVTNQAIIWADAHYGRDKYTSVACIMNLESNDAVPCNIFSLDKKPMAIITCNNYRCDK